MIDLRSDTVTKPTPAMLQAMMEAKVGDDVFGEDIMVNTLQQKAAEMFSMEAGLFCPSGTMTNQIAIKCHTNPGDEVICDEDSHIYQYEGGGIAFNSGCSVKLLQGDRGRITANQIIEAINANDVHKAHTSLVSLENTSNRGGGSCYSFDEILKIKELCVQEELSLHLDGARLFNALQAKGQSAPDFGKTFDSISICLSKSLGCPIGSLLLGSDRFIQKARRIRKVLGGGMRQAGYMAAAGIFALENNIERLDEDHKHAMQIGTAIELQNYVDFILPIETNILIFQLKQGVSAHKWVETFKQHNILGYAITSNRVRLVLHLDVTPIMVTEIINTVKAIHSFS